MDQTPYVKIKGGEHAIEQQRQIRPVVGVAAVVRRLPLHLPTVDAPQRVVQRLEDEEVPRGVALDVVVGRYVSIAVERLCPCRPLLPPSGRTQRPET